MRGGRSAAPNRPKSSAPRVLSCPARCRRAANLRPCTRLPSRPGCPPAQQAQDLIDLLTGAGQHEQRRRAGFVSGRSQEPPLALQVSDEPAPGAQHKTTARLDFRLSKPIHILIYQLRKQPCPPAHRKRPSQRFAEWPPAHAAAADRARRPRRRGSIPIFGPNWCRCSGGPAKPSRRRKSRSPTA